MISEANSINSSKKRWQKIFLYGFLWLATNGVLWSIALIYAKTVNPEYVSEWTITLPPAGSSTNVNLPGIGNASATVESPFDNASTRDPRENYKFILTSQPVVDQAADLLGIPPSEFGRPSVEIINNTTLMSLEISGDTPQEAKQKALALNNAFQDTLGDLRAQERAQLNEGVQRALSNAEAKLKQAQSRLSDYQERSGLASMQQIDQVSSNIEELRREKAFLFAQLNQADARLGELSTSLRVSSQQASEAFQLSADSIFQQHLSNYSEAVATIESLEEQLGPNHPIMLKEVARRGAAQEALVDRGRELLGRPVDLAMLAQLDISTTEGTTGREQLFQNTVLAQVDKQGLSAQVTALDQQIAQLENRLRSLAQNGATLESLQRDVSVAEAVFSATLARLDLNQADLFGSYPQIQVVTDPSLPSGNQPLKAMIALVGALFSSFLITTGLATLLIRDLKKSRYLVSQFSKATSEQASLKESSNSQTVSTETELISGRGNSEE
jgi:uncharacterized protein involved in exopolysaccharide biosynthesis